jgi:D-glycero-alpha-D-manno-heptose-7-phosphate kinase
MGGGSDLPAFYLKNTGRVVSTSIDKYIYITVNQLSEYFDYSLMLKYSQTETCNSIDEIKHPIIRECLKKVGIHERLEITSMADLPAGTGLGSSSSFTVGLLHALYAYQGKTVTKKQLAKEACEIEIDILKEPIGKQDQFAASYGGFNDICFYQDNTVKVNDIDCYSELKQQLDNNLLLFYTGITRKASDILSEQKNKTEIDYRTVEFLKHLVDQCDPFLDSILKTSTIVEIGYLLHSAWNYKKLLVESISNQHIDEYYNKSLSAGAVGGKLLGAGGGGCLLFYVEPKNHESVRLAMSNLREVKFKFENDGTKIIYQS